MTERGNESPTERRWASVIAAFIVLGVVAIYLNSLDAPFVFDDVGSIEENATIRELWPLARPLSPPRHDGLTVSGRPILNLSFALNYALSELDVWSYHAGNVAIHACAALLLFGVVRRTLLQPVFSARWTGRETITAGAIAAIWAAHPLQTEAVTYVVQRAESLMGLFFLGALYAFVRSVESPRPLVWRIVAVAACLLGVGTKEVAVLIPLIVLLYDCTFITGSFRGAWRRHRPLYVALVATWLPLAWFVAWAGGDRGGTVGFNVGMSPIDYWLTQPEAIARYFSLCLWPHPLVFDYGRVPAPGWLAALAWGVPVGVLALATCLALWRWPTWGFLGAWCFAILAPTTIMPGALQMIVEHRMYLPLAAIAAALVAPVARWLPPRWFAPAMLGLAIACGLLTVRRNETYRSEERLWRETLAHRPENARALNNLGRVYDREGRYEAALPLLKASLRLDPLPQTYFNLGLALIHIGRPAEAIEPLQTAVGLLPHYYHAHLNLGNALTSLQRAEEALSHYSAAIHWDPAPAEPLFRRGVAFAQLGRWHEAVADYARACELEPQRAEAFSNWGVALLELGDVPQAVQRFEAAAALKPESPEIHYNLGTAASAHGRVADAVRHYREAVRLKADYAEAQLNLGIALGQSGDLRAGLEHLERAAQIRPDWADAHTNLGIAFGLDGRATDALRHYERALELRPGDPGAHYNVGFALLQLRRVSEARARFEQALRVQPDFAPAREMLQRLPQP